MPWLGRPTSYASGYRSAQRTSVSSHAFTVEFTSPPTYCTGFLTSGSSGSSCGKTDSADMSLRVPAARQRTVATTSGSRDPAGAAGFRRVTGSGRLGGGEGGGHLFCEQGEGGAVVGHFEKVDDRVAHAQLTELG